MKIFIRLFVILFLFTFCSHKEQDKKQLFEKLINTLDKPRLWLEADYSTSFFAKEIEEYQKQNPTSLFNGCDVKNSLPSVIWQVNRGTFEGFNIFDSDEERLKSTCEKNTKEILASIFKSTYFTKLIPSFNTENSSYFFPKESTTEGLSCSQVLFKEDKILKLNKEKVLAIENNKSDYEFFCSFNVFDKNGAELIAGTFTLYAKPNKCVLVSPGDIETLE